MFREAAGDAAVDRAWAALPPEDREILESAVPAAWIPVPILDSFYTSIAEFAGQDLQTFYPEVVKRGISQTLRSVWRVLLRLTSDRALVSRTPVIYSRGHSVGKIAADIHGPGQATLVLTQWPNMPDLRRLGVASGIRAVLEVAGRKEVHVDYEGTEDGAVYRVRWRA
jgi:hypothetical protein